MTKLLNKVNYQLNKQGIIIKTGEASIIDASVVQAKNNRPRKNAKGENVPAYKVAGKYQVAPKWTLSAGYANYGQSDTTVRVVPAIPQTGGSSTCRFNNGAYTFNCGR